MDLPAVYAIPVFFSTSVQGHPGGDLPLKPAVRGGKRSKPESGPKGVAPILLKAEPLPEDLVTSGRRPQE